MGPMGLYPLGPMGQINSISLYFGLCPLWAIRLLWAIGPLWLWPPLGPIAPSGPIAPLWAIGPMGRINSNLLYFSISRLWGLGGPI